MGPRFNIPRLLIQWRVELFTTLFGRPWALQTRLRNGIPRLPAQGSSVDTSRNVCLECARELRWAELLPCLSKDSKNREATWPYIQAFARNCATQLFNMFVLPASHSLTREMRREAASVTAITLATTPRSAMSFDHERKGSGGTLQGLEESNQLLQPGISN